MTAIVCADAGAASLSMQWGVGPGRPDQSEFRKVGEDVLGAVKYLLCALAAEPGVVRSRDALMREVWGWADASGTRTLDSHVKALRAKIGADRVRTVHGVGYALEATP